MASEESEELIPPSQLGRARKHVLFFDPLDGSSNIDVNVSIGTIFSLYRRRSVGGAAQLDDFLQPGTDQVMGGYFLYGSSTMLIYTAAAGVHGFTLDPGSGEFLLSHPGIATPGRGKVYSCNEGNSLKWDESTRRYVAAVKHARPNGVKPYSARYVGSFVADFHRNLLQGGIFLYPGQRDDPSKPFKGKLRLMYEANPMAFIVEQAGGLATDGETQIREILPRDIHQRTALVIGSHEDVEEYLLTRVG
jgi:fructose-1,6-bisphosphatase I